MDWNDYNWTMEEKGKEIFVFFELFCGLVIFMAWGDWQNNRLY